MDKRFPTKTLIISLILNLLFGLSLLSIIQNLIFAPLTDYPADPIYNYMGVKLVSLPWWGIPALILFRNGLVGFPLLILQFFLGWVFWWVFISGVIFLKRIILKGLGK